MTSRLLQAALELAHAAHLARQPQLTDDNQAVWQWPVVLVADDRQGKTEIGGRLRHPDAAGDADEDVRISELVIKALFKDRDDHVEAVDVDAGGRPPHDAVVVLFYEGLNLHPPRPGSPADRPHCGGRRGGG